jgi:hypothetical protein
VIGIFIFKSFAAGLPGPLVPGATIANYINKGAPTATITPGTTNTPVMSFIAPDTWKGVLYTPDIVLKQGSGLLSQGQVLNDIPRLGVPMAGIGYKEDATATPGFHGTEAVVEDLNGNHAYDDAADRLIDGDGSATPGPGSIDDGEKSGDTLTPMGTDIGTGGVSVCTDSLSSPNAVRISLGKDCTGGTDGTYVLGIGPTSATTEVTNAWAFYDKNKDGIYEDGEDIFIQNVPNAPGGLKFAASADVNVYGTIGLNKGDPLTDFTAECAGPGTQPCKFTNSISAALNANVVVAGKQSLIDSTSSIVSDVGNAAGTAPNGVVDQQADQLTAITIENFGTAVVGTDIATVNIWANDKHDNVFNAALDRPLGKAINAGGYWYLNTFSSSPVIPAGGLEIDVTADIADGAINGHTLQFGIPTLSDNGPVGFDAPLAGVNPATIGATGNTGATDKTVKTAADAAKAVAEKVAADAVIPPVIPPIVPPIVPPAVAQVRCVTQAAQQAVAALPGGVAQLAGDQGLFTTAQDNGPTDKAVMNPNIQTINATLSPPVASSAAGNYTGPLSVSFNTDDSTTILYTTDNTDPYACEIGLLYSGPIDISSSTKIEARRFDAVGNMSALASFNYSINGNVRSSGNYVPQAQIAPTLISPGVPPVVTPSISTVQTVSSTQTSAPISAGVTQAIAQVLIQQAAYKTIAQTQIKNALSLVTQVQADSPDRCLNSSCAVFTQDLRLGSTGIDVKKLQILLNKNGFLLAATGAGSPGLETMYFGSKTFAAVVAFEKAYNLLPLGIVGPINRGALAAMVTKQLTSATQSSVTPTVQLPIVNPPTNPLVVTPLPPVAVSQVVVAPNLNLFSKFNLCRASGRSVWSCLINLFQ